MISPNPAIRIVFMGTPDFAVAGLAKLVTTGYQVVGVITAPDRPAGRGRKIHESAVKQYAVAQGIPVLQPKNLKDKEFLKALKAWNGTLQVVVAFRMLPAVVWQLPTYGTFNLHASLLPQYRGAAPINWALINGETKTGVTTFFIDDKIDTGAILLQRVIDIAPDEDAGSLHDKLMELGAEVILETVQLIAQGAAIPTKQKESEALKPAPKIFRDDCKIDWQWKAETVYNFVRGLSPYPVAWTTIQNGETPLVVKLYKVAVEKTNHSYKIGSVLSSKTDLKIAVSDGFISVLELQLPGKRKMPTKAVLNGFQFKKEAYAL